MYQPEQHEGPLSFKIILYVLHYKFSETAKKLVNVFKTLKIMKHNGENVETVVSLICGLFSRLRNLVDARGQSELPEDFSDDILDIFNTTSATKTNALFANYSIATRLTEFHTKTYNKPHIDEIVSLTDDKYFCLYSIRQWSGVGTKTNTTSFTAITHGNFFNCGCNYSLKNLRKPKNEEHIKSNKKLFYEKNKKGNERSCTKKGNYFQNKGKWDTPTGSKNKNVIVLILTERNIIITIKKNSERS